jgi:hypothetical protein
MTKTTARATVTKKAAGSAVRVDDDEQAMSPSTSTGVAGMTIYEREMLFEEQLRASLALVHSMGDRRKSSLVRSDLQDFVRYVAKLFGAEPDVDWVSCENCGGTCIDGRYRCRCNECECTGLMIASEVVPRDDADGSDEGDPADGQEDE